VETPRIWSDWMSEEGEAIWHHEVLYERQE